MNRHKHTPVHRITEQFRLERMSEVSCPTSCSNQGHWQGLIRLLRALFSLVLNTSKDRDQTTSLLPCMIALVGKRFFLYPFWTSCFNVCLLSLILCHIPLWWVWLYFPADLLVSTGRLLLGPPKASPSAGWVSPTPSPSSHRAWSPALTALVTSAELQFINIFLVWGGTKTRHSIIDAVYWIMSKGG